MEWWKICYKYFYWFYNDDLFVPYEINKFKDKMIDEGLVCKIKWFSCIIVLVYFKVGVMMDALYDLACNMEEGYYNGSLTIDDIPSIEGEDILVNAENPIDSSYIPSRVLQVHEFCGKKMDERQAVLTTPLCYIAFYLMRKDAMKNGIAYLILYAIYIATVFIK